MKSKSIIPNVVGMVVISCLLIFGTSRCSGPVPQASQPDITEESASVQTAPDTSSEETDAGEKDAAEPAEKDAAEPAEKDAAEPAEKEAPVSNAGSGPDALPFLDVPEGEWYRDSVAYVFGRGLMNGVTGDSFAPDEPVSSGMLVTILHRMAGSPAAEAALSFQDVEPGSYCEAPVSWAAGAGIVNGYPDGTFLPENSVTREQMAAILYRYAQSTGTDTGASADISLFEDRNMVNDYAVAPLSWANAVNLINGVTETLLDPLGNASRGQTAAIIMRYEQQIQGSSAP